MMKRILAVSLVLTCAGVVSPFALANNGINSGGFPLSANPATMPANNFATPYQPESQTEDIALRGHLTAVPKGTMMMVKVDQPLNSASSKVGDPITAIVEADVFMNNQIVIPAGSQVEGAVTQVSPAGHVGKAGSMEVQFSVIRTTYGHSYPVRARVVTSDESGIIRGDSPQAQVFKTLGTAAGGTAAGTLMGTAAGSLLGSAGGGAMFGLAAGSLAGVGYALLREGKEVVIPTGARMSIVLDQPIAVN